MILLYLFGLCLWRRPLPEANHHCPRQSLHSALRLRPFLALHHPSYFVWMSCVIMATSRTSFYCHFSAWVCLSFLWRSSEVRRPSYRCCCGSRSRISCRSEVAEGNHPATSWTLWLFWQRLRVTTAEAGTRPSTHSGLSRRCKASAMCSLFQWFLEWFSPLSSCFSAAKSYCLQLEAVRKNFDSLHRSLRKNSFMNWLSTMRLLIFVEW